VATASNPATPDPTVPTPAAEPVPPELSPPPSTEPIPGPGDESAIARVRQAWPAILQRLAGSSRVAWTAFHAATPVSCTNGVLAVAVAEPGSVRAIAQRGHDERLRQALLDVLALDVTIDVLHDPEPARPPDGTSGTGTPTPDTPNGPGSAAGTTSPDRAPVARPGDVVREAGSGPAQDDVSDEPSPDDPDLETGGANGLALITRELGARPIGEIDHS
jgi:DNA polymerase-3 subunit gamma/tau